MPRGGGGKPGGGGGGGGDGPLSLNGNRKDNVLVGGSYGDNIWGRDGNDILIGNGGGVPATEEDPGTIDLLVGGDGDDILVGDFATVDENGNVILGDSSDDPEGVAGPDHLFGGNGDDSLYGGGGDDELQGGDGHDYLDGGDGFDIALYTADDYSIVVTSVVDGYKIEFVTIEDVSPGPLEDEQALNIEGIAGTYYDDMMTGANDRENWFDGYYGNDSITGGGLDDAINGGGDNDTIDGAGGNDLLLGGSGKDSIAGGIGDDSIDGGADSDVIDGGVGNDTITGGSGDDTMTGGGDADLFVFYRLETDDGDATNDPDPIYGQGNDMISGYNQAEGDALLFHTNTVFVPVLSNNGVDTTVTYADGAAIVLQGVVIINVADLNYTVDSAYDFYA